jgi:CheY-like chemotaxis protein
MASMSRILAVETDRERAWRLKKLVREHVRAKLIVAPTVQAAIAVINERIPDLILVSAFLPPNEESDLIAHVRQLTHAPYLQMLSIPAIAMVDEPAADNGRLFSVFSRSSQPARAGYNRDAVGAQIEEYLERGRSLREEHEAMQACRALVAPGALVDGHALMASNELVRANGEERWRARRSTRSELPWLSGIRLSWGLELGLLNISSSGVLVETTTKLMPGTSADIVLTGPETNLVVPARFVRSEVARIDTLGVRYQAAAAFDSTLELMSPARPAPAALAPKALADLLTAVLAEGEARSVPACERFAQGLRRLSGVRDIQVREIPIAPHDDSESIYFDVPGRVSSRAVLQVMFDPRHAVQESEFRLLRAAAWMTAAVLEMDRTDSFSSSQSTALVRRPSYEPVLEVA